MKKDGWQRGLIFRKDKRIKGAKMCGIVGFYSKRKSKKEVSILKKVLIESNIRGLHSFGVAFDKDKKIIIEKQKEFNIDELLYGFLDNVGSKRLIYHSRYSTSGDFKDEKNNPPILVKNIALVLNGVISMERKIKFEKRFGIKCSSENDGEIILRQKDYLKFLEENPEVSFAGIFFDGKNLLALRNNKRPLYRFNYGKATYLVSTIDIAKRAGIRCGNINPIEPYHMEII